jgi:transposase
MRIAKIFGDILDLQAARVTGVSMTEDSIEVSVQRRAKLHRCPHCSFSTRGRHDQHVGRWRHVALGRWKVWLVATVARLECPEHGVLTEAVPWAAPQSTFTLDFEELVGWLARESNRTAITQLVHIGWRTVGNILERLVGRKLSGDRLNGLFNIGVDEVSYRKRHRYLSVIANHDTGKAVWLGEGKSGATLDQFFDELGPERIKQLRVVTIDMSAAYISVVTDRAPQAQIAFDPFHVVKLANEAVHDVRRTEARGIKDTPAAEVLKDSRWALLKAPENLVPKERLKLAEVERINQKVFRAYLLKEELRALYRCSINSASTHLDSWLAWASRSKLAPFVKMARTVRQYRDGILAAIELKLSNGRLEGLNNKIGMIQRRAYGFHTAAALISLVYLCCSHVDVKLPI